MEKAEFIEIMSTEDRIIAGSEVHRQMHVYSDEARRISSKINGEYHTQEELVKLFSELFGKEVDESFRVFPPFYTDCGKNINVGKTYLSIRVAVFRITAELK